MRLPTYISVLVMFSISCQPVSNQDEFHSQKPNIIFILADDLGYGDVGAFGQDRIQTPNLDLLAAEGIRFTQHYAGSTVCAPSRCVLMTGKHTGHSRIRGNATVPLQPEDVTVAELLKIGGYTTGLIGKWGLGEAGSAGIPNNQGFDYFFGYLNQIHAHNYYPAYLWENEYRVELENEVVTVEEGYAKGIGGYSTNKVDYSHDLFTEKTLEFVREKRDTSFFLYLAYTLPHANNESHFNNEHGMEIPDYGQYDDKDWPEAQKGHAAMISRLDKDIGELIDVLTELGIEDQTLIVFSSDNGPHQEGKADPEFFNSNGPLRGMKRDLYEGGIRVPTLAYWPGTIAPGTQTDHISAFWDFLPTACDVAGIDIPDSLDIDGISYLPALTGQQQPIHDYLYWEFHEQGKKQAVRKEDWKLIYFLQDDVFELYNLSDDIGESQDFSDSNPEILSDMKSIMNNARTENEYFPWVTK